MPKSRQAARLKTGAAGARRGAPTPRHGTARRRRPPAPTLPDPHTGGPSRFPLVTCGEAWARLRTFAPLDTESVPVSDASGRVLARELRATIDLPHFARSYMDGFAVRARDTDPAGPASPARLRIVGTIEIGCAARRRLAAGETVRIPTGGMLPPGADAVVMVEHSRPDGDGHVAILRAAATGEHVMRRGEDIRKGDRLFARGHRFRPHDVGALAGAGVSRVRVYRRPRVALIATGDEIVPPEVRPRPGQVRSVNQYALAAMITAAGGRVIDLGVIPDRLAAIRRALEHGLRRADMVAISGGSSVGTKDLTVAAVAATRGAKILVHGVRIKPGKPTLLARAGTIPILGVPGHPVSALVIFELFGIALVRLLEGEPAAQACTPRRRVWARLATAIPSKPGREDYARVVLDERPEGWQARPLAGGSADIYSLVRADGMVRIDAEASELAAGTAVLVHLFS